MSYCNKCGKEIGNQNFCPNCGASNIDAGANRTYGQGYDNRYPPNQPYNSGYAMKNPGTAAILAALLGFIGITGIGHIYVEKVKKGVTILIGFIVLMILGFFLLFPWIFALILWVWQIFDAYNLAKEYNDSVMMTGRPPRDW